MKLASTSSLPARDLVCALCLLGLSVPLHFFLPASPVLPHFLFHRTCFICFRIGLSLACPFHQPESATPCALHSSASHPRQKPNRRLGISRHYSPLPSHISWNHAFQPMEIGYAFMINESIKTSTTSLLSCFVYVRCICHGVFFFWGF